MNSLYIAGEWLAGQGDAFQSLNPVTQQVLWAGEGATTAQVESAVQAAIDAARGDDATEIEVDQPGFAPAHFCSDQGLTSVGASAKARRTMRCSLISNCTACLW